MIFIVALIFLNSFSNSKYIEGEINSNEEWIFLARFCFLSHQGLFEYHLEFNEDIGEPNLLLYYDSDDQWPSVYKSNKNCLQKEAVVHMEQNQIINLTAAIPYYSRMAGCTYKNEITTKKPNISFNITLPIRHNTRTTSKHGTTKMTARMPSDPPTEPATQTENFTDPVEISSDETTQPLDELKEFPTTTDDPKMEYEILPGLSTEAGFIRNDRKTPIKKRHVPIEPKRKRSRTVICQNARSFSSSRERWWFIALSNCNRNKGIHIKYKILMTNGPPGDYWHEHLSADEFYILPVLTAFAVAYAFLQMAVVICSIELKSRHMLHATYKIYSFSVVMHLIGVLIELIAYIKYATTGLDTQKVKRAGAVLLGASETSFLLLLLLLAKGYTTTRGRLPIGTSVKLTVFMCIYSVTYTAIFIYEAKVFDPGEVLYQFESPAGYELIALRIIAWIVFISSTVFTLKLYPEKANFYYPFNICGTIWFVAGPAFILSANTYIDKWIRESVVCAVLQFISFGGHLSFLILTVPTVANKNFPYHVRTTQIAAMEITTIEGNTTVERFRHHPYEPAQEQTVIIPLTKRTEEIFEEMYTRNTYGGSKRGDVITEELPRDVAMENVLNWSMAKNCSDTGGFSKRESIASSNSVFSNENSSKNTSRRTSLNQNNGLLTVNGRFNDYVHEVPLELFTVSRMVLKRDDTTKE